MSAAARTIETPADTIVPDQRDQWVATALAAAPPIPLAAIAAVRDARRAVKP